MKLESGICPSTKDNYKDDTDTVQGEIAVHAVYDKWSISSSYASKLYDLTSIPDLASRNLSYND